MENLITDGRYDQVTTELSREIINVLKRGVKRYQAQIILFSRTKVDVNVYFHYKEGDNFEVSGAAYTDPQLIRSVRKHYKNKRIVLHVEAPADPEVRKRIMSSIVSELKNTIRHEIEHIAQSKFVSRERKGFFSTKRAYPEHLSYFEYLMEPYEVEAWVRGFYKKAKTQRQPLKTVLDDWFNYLQSSQFLTPQEVVDVRDSWVNYAKKHLAKTPQRQYGYSDEVENVNVNVNEAIGFRASYMKPNIDVIINFRAPDAGKDLKPILEDILKRKNIQINSISVGTGKNGNCQLDLSFFNEREIQHLIDDLHRELMVLHSVRIQDVTHYIK